MAVIERLLQDGRYGARQLASAPLFTVIAAASLGVGIAVTVTVFSFVNAVLFKPLPLPDPGSLVHVFSSSRVGEYAYTRFSYADLKDLRDSGVFSGVAAENDSDITTTVDNGVPRNERIAFVSPDFFAVLGVRFAQGRSFSPQGDELEIVISDQFRRRAFAPGERVIGASVRLRDVVYTVIGVTASEFRGANVFQPAAAWVPVPTYAVYSPASVAGLSNRTFRRWSVLARLAAGTSRDDAMQRLTVTSRRLADTDPRAWRDERGAPLKISVLSQRQSIVRPDDVQAQAFLATITAIVLVIMILACVNVAGLMLARAITRRHEIAVRLTLGASRSRLIAQLLTEALLLALLGGAIGLLVTYWVITAAGKSRLLEAFDLTADWRVYGVAALVSLLSVLVFAVTPIGQALRVDVKAGLSGEGVVGARAGVRGRLIALQVCLSCLLMLIAMSTGRGVTAKLYGGANLDLDNILVAELQLSSFRRDSLRAATYLEDGLNVLRSIPGVQHVTLTSRVPLTGGEPWVPSTIDLPSSGPTLVGHHEVGPGYFETLGIRLESGRTVREQDVGSTTAVVVNRAFADAWGSEVVGRAILLNGRELNIVGVVENVAHHAGEHARMPYIYSAARSTAWWRAPRVFIVARVHPAAQQQVTAQLTRTYHRRYDNRPPPSIATLRSRVDAVTAPQRYVANFALILGTTELVLAALGLYSLLLYTLMSRTREVGLRIALGARPHHASFTIIRSGLAYVAAGTLLGLLLCIPAAISAADSFIGVDARDPVPFIAMVGSILVASAAAAILPALKAARVEPMRALRSQ
jgi:predicted permease